MAISYQQHLVPLTLTHPDLSKCVGQDAGILCLQILLLIKGRVPEIPDQALPSGRQRENVPDGFWEGEAGFWHGHSSLQGDSHSHTG